MLFRDIFLLTLTKVYSERGIILLNINNVERSLREVYCKEVDRLYERFGSETGGSVISFFEEHNI